MGNWLETHMLPCFFKQMTGMDCPTCGMQRSFVALLKGDIAGSWHFYPPLFSILLTMAVLIVHVRFRFSGQHTIMRLAIGQMLAVILVNYIYKVI